MSDTTSGPSTTDVTAAPKWRGHVFRALRWLVGIATVVVLVRVASDQADELRDVELTLVPGWLVPAGLLTVAAGLILPLAWRQLLAAYGWPIDQLRALRAWCLSQATRYLPTGAMAVASRLSLTASEGVPRSVAAASFALETVLLLGWASLLGAIFIPSSVFPLVLRVMLGVGAATGLITLPWSLRLVGNRIPRLEALSGARLRERELMGAVGLFGLNTALRAGRLLALAAALLPMTFGDVPLILGASYAGVVAGMIGITPAGIGVREGVIAAILADRFGIGDAAALAVLLRAWDFLFEVAFLAGATWFGRASRRRPTTPR